MTLYEIEILSHYHSREGDWHGLNFGTPLYESTIAEFLALDLLKKGVDSSWMATDRCHAFCDALQQVKLPVQKWVME